MTLIQKVKANLILEHEADDELLEMFIAAAVSYAESYQHGCSSPLLSVMPRVISMYQKISIAKILCHRLQSKPLLCFPLIFMKAEMAVQVDSLLTTWEPDSKSGIRSIYFYDLIGTGRCRL